MVFCFVYIKHDLVACSVYSVHIEYYDDLYSPLVRHHRLLVDDVLVSCYEISENWGKFDAFALNTLSFISPKIMESTWFRRYTYIWDQYVSSVISKVDRTIRTIIRAPIAVFGRK